MVDWTDPTLDEDYLIFVKTLLFLNSKGTDLSKIGKRSKIWPTGMIRH